MHETNEDEHSGADPLAEIVRAAGRRAAPPQEHYDQVYAAAHAVWQRKVSARQHRSWYALAASVALIACGGLLWQLLPSSPPSIAASVMVTVGNIEQYVEENNNWILVDEGASVLHAGSRIRTGNDSAMALRLADGGSLRLNSNTELVLDGALLRLNSGTLYFDSVGRPPGMTIDVVTRHGTVRDIGTQFEVLTSAELLRVRVRSGSIALLDSSAAAPVSGLSGEEINLSAAGQLSRREFAPDDPQWAWTESLAVVPDFDTPTVLRYLRWIADETGKKLEFERESVRLQAEIARFLGDPSDLMPTELLITITATSDFSYEITADGSILIRRDNLPTLP